MGYSQEVRQRTLTPSFRWFESIQTDQSAVPTADSRRLRFRALGRYPDGEESKDAGSGSRKNLLFIENRIKKRK